MWCISIADDRLLGDLTTILCQTLRYYAGAAAVSESEGGVSAPSSRPTVARLCDVVEATFLKGRLIGAAAASTRGPKHYACLRD